MTDDDETGDDREMVSLPVEDLIALKQALSVFGNYADQRRTTPESMPITHGSPMAKKQLTMGDCYRAATALANLGDI